MNRIQNYLNTKEVDPQKMVKFTNNFDEEIAVKINNKSFSWGVKEDEDANKDKKKKKKAKKENMKNET